MRRPVLLETLGGGPAELLSAAQRLLPFRCGLAALDPLGFEPEPREEESEAGYENRLGTRLMAIYRDTRDAQAFEALHALTQASVQRWIAGLLRRAPAAIDLRELVQDTFVNVYLYPGGFRDEHDGSFRVWVRTIAGNLVRRALARAANSARQPLPEGAGEPADMLLSPEREALCREQDRELRRAWALLLSLYAQAYSELADRDRRALELVEVHGLSYIEAGERLCVGRSNMKMIVFRARRRIANRIALRCPRRPSDAPRDEQPLRLVG